MKKVEIETECGETTIVYISQDIKNITIDGEKYNQVELEEIDNRLPTERHIELKTLLENILQVMDETNLNHWSVFYRVNEDKFEFDWRGCTFPREIFQTD